MQPLQFNRMHLRAVGSHYTYAGFLIAAGYRQKESVIVYLFFVWVALKVRGNCGWYASDAFFERFLFSL